MPGCRDSSDLEAAIREPTITWLFAGSGSKPLPVIVIWLPAVPEPALRPLSCGAAPVGFCNRTKNGAMSTSVACRIPAVSRTCANRRNVRGPGATLEPTTTLFEVKIPSPATWSPFAPSSVRKTLPVTGSSTSPSRTVE